MMLLRTITLKHLQLYSLVHNFTRWWF